MWTRGRACMRVSTSPSGIAAVVEEFIVCSTYSDRTSMSSKERSKFSMTCGHRSCSCAEKRCRSPWSSCGMEAAHLPDSLDIHRAEYLVHALYDHSHRLCHLLHLHCGLKTRGDGVDPGRQAQVILRARLGPDSILGVDSCPFVVILLEALFYLLLLSLLLFEALGRQSPHLLRCELQLK